MGQKTKPTGLRLGVNRTWDSRWFGTKSYSDFLHQDLKLRKFLFSKLKSAAVSKIVIERPAGKTRVTIYAGRPGLVIGKKGQDIDGLRKNLEKETGNEVNLNIVEVRKPELDAQLIADNIAEQLERRASFRRTMKRAIQSALRLGAKGIKIVSGGRLGGAEIARIEWYREGRVPLHSLRANIGYGVSTSHTAYGTIGIKVWVYTGEESSNIEKQTEETKKEKINKEK